MKGISDRMIVTLSVTGLTTAAVGLMFLYYNFYLLSAVKADHERARAGQSAQDAILEGKQAPTEV
jgi:hypothetical protein